MTLEERTRPELGALRDVPYMGVIFVVAEAVKLGFWNGHPDWCNLGQGQPEVGEMDGAPARILSVELDPADCAYGPLEGTEELRERVAGHYNRLYRAGMSSQYTAANVSVAGGGRLALTRAMAALAGGNVGYQNPDYTAYEDMFNLHLDRVEPVPVESGVADGFAIPSERLRREVREKQLRAFIYSNPCNPTGVVIQGDELDQYVRIAREEAMTLFSDEFYSHFIYTPGADGVARPGAGPVSAAAYVDDVDRDPVLIFDGLTKSYRYPGWRLGWVLGPPAMVESMARTASSIDGGPSRVAQRAALAVLEPERADQETGALREVFCAKRNLMMRRLSEMGVRFVHPNASTFYCWGSLEDLPAPLNDGTAFFRAALEHKVMTVPGEYFDVNPGKRRTGDSPFRQWMRFSFGPPMDNVKMGLERLEAMVAAARSGVGVSVG
jgi:hypothetical protein